MAWTMRASSILLGFLCWGSLQAQPAYLVRDIRPGPDGASPELDPAREFRAASGAGSLFFFAADSGAGYGIWETDGSFAGTRKLVAVQRKAESLSGSGAVWFPTDLVSSGALLFFAQADSRGVELWKTDGTAAGTGIVKDIKPGPGHSLFAAAKDETDSYFGSLTDVEGTLFFVADDGVHGRSLWKSDGTPAGTVLVRTFAGPPYHLTSFQGRLFFAAEEAGKTHLWKTDGTPAGTVIVRSFSAQIPRSPLSTFAVSKDLLFLPADDGQGIELWKSDGASASIVKDVVPGRGGSFPTSLCDAKGTLFFLAKDPLTGEDELWRSDGTAAGTLKAADPFPSPDRGIIVAAGSRIFLVAKDGAHGWELWTSDGKPSGTRFLQDILPGPTGSFPSFLGIAGGTLFFSAPDGVHGEELWGLTVSDALDSEVVVDNGGAGTASSGWWSLSGATGSYGKNSVWSKGTPTVVPEYSFEPTLTPGTYDVFEWHSVWSSRTRFARHRIAHAGGIAEVMVDQSVQGGGWNFLGTYVFQTKGHGRVTIRAEDLDRSTNADAIGYVCRSRELPVAVIDAIVPSPATPGGQTCFEGHGVSPSPIVAYEWRSSIQPGLLLGDQKSFCRTDLIVGTHVVTLRVMDQSGTWSFPVARTLKVASAPAPTEVIVDNGKQGTQSAGSWMPSGTPGAYGTESLWTKPYVGAGDFWYSFSATLPDGRYEVFEWHTIWATRSRAVKHRITSGGGLDATVTVDQSVGGGRWNSLGTYRLNGLSTVKIMATDTERSTNADAIRFVRKG